jgi:hypothetical protein
MTTAKPTTFRVPGDLGRALGAFRARLVVAALDGTPLSADDQASVKALLEVWALRDRKLAKLARLAAGMLPAREAPPSPAIIEAQAKARGRGGKTPKPTRPRRKAAKRPGR